MNHERFCQFLHNVTGQDINPSTAKLLIGIFTHMKLCLADAIHNFKWVKIIQI